MMPRAPSLNARLGRTWVCPPWSSSPLVLVNCSACTLLSCIAHGKADCTALMGCIAAVHKTWGYIGSPVSLVSTGPLFSSLLAIGLLGIIKQRHGSVDPFTGLTRIQHVDW